MHAHGYFQCLQQARTRLKAIKATFLARYLAADERLWFLHVCARGVWGWRVR